MNFWLRFAERHVLGDSAAAQHTANVPRKIAMLHMTAEEQFKKSQPTKSHEPTILVIDEDVPIRRLLRTAFAREGYRTIEAVNRGDAILLASTRQPDLTILELQIGDTDGLELLRQLRERLSAPIVIVSSRASDQDKIAALDAGADDFVTKPFATAELMARIRVAFRHAARTAGRPAPVGPIAIGELKIDVDARRVFARDRDVSLTPLEYRLLLVLAQHAGKTLTHAFLLEEVWGADYACEVQYLRVFIANLRRKLEDDPSKPRFLLTQPGVGYCLLASG